MAIIVFHQPVPFPIAPLRAMLAQHLSLYKWQCGENDTGAREQMGTYSPSDMIIGRADGDMVMVPLTARSGCRSAAAPPHEWSLELGRPTTDDQRLSDRITMVICSVLMIPDEDHARCQLIPDGRWLSAAETVGALRLVEKGATLADALSGKVAETQSRYANLPNERAMALAQIDESFARILNEQGMGAIAETMGLTKAPDFAHEMPRDDRLPTLVMLSKAPLYFDWLRIAEGIEAIDPDGDWTVEPAGPNTGRLIGRGAAVTLSCDHRAMPRYLTAQGMAREHYLTPDLRQQIESHSCQHIISVDLDTRAADFMAVRQTAKAVAMFMALPATSSDFVGLFNAGTGVAKPAQRVRDSIAALHQDEVPLQVWTWVAADSPVTDAVSLSSAGMRPFVGYEVECWNAPGTIESVGNRLNGVMRYLIINGPVIGHGDTIGDHAGDRSTRCFLGTSKAQRGQGEPVPAMLIEFDGQSGATPKPDAPITSAPGADDMRAMLGELRKGADATSTKALDAIADAIADPPPRDVIESDANPVFENLMKLIEHEQTTGRLPKPVVSTPGTPAQPTLNGRPVFGRKPTTGFGRKGL